MKTAAAYILKVPESRREILLEQVSGGYYSDAPSVAEPVARFNHSKRAPLIVFACFEDDAITHLAQGSRGAYAGTGLVRLDMSGIELLIRPIRFSELTERAPARFRLHFDKTLESGGILPPRTLGALVDIVLALQPELATRLARFSERREKQITKIGEEARTMLAMQKDALTTALQLAGLETEEVLSWSPNIVEEKTSEQTSPADEGVKRPRSFLEGLSQAVVREDAALIADFNTLPGFEVIKNYHFAAKTFHSSANRDLRLTVVMANRLPLEKQTGADLIYYNETYKSFVLIQYKSMDRGNEGAAFRWQPNDKLAEEIGRMDALLKDLQQVPHDVSPMSFRLHSNPFFLKLCPRLIFNPDDKGLFKGIYLPLELWRSLSKDPITLGPRGGRILTFDNVGRKLTNTEFITMVSNAWIGTTVPQSDMLGRVIEDVIQSGRTVTLAVKSKPTATKLDEDQPDAS
ncbi:MAG: hypothetical protein ACK54P_09105 [Bacteroidota bacterium]